MIRIELNDDAVTTALARLSTHLGDTTDVMNDIGRLLVASTKERIAAGKTPEGTAFAPRSLATLARYDALGKKYGPPLNVSGEMRQTIFHSYGPDQAEVGSNAIQSAVMQFGAAQGAFGARMGRTRPTEKRPKSQDYFFPIPWGDIPARPFLGISEEDRTGIIATIEEWLDGAIADGG